jgi:hypothetical protein
VNLDGLVKVGRSPWRPNDDVSELDVWHMDDVPTLGTFSFAGDVWLFSVVVDVEERTTVWGYVPLTPEDLDALGSATFATMAEVQAFADEAFADREITLAGADEFVIERWGRHHAPSLMAAASAFIREWVQTMLDNASDRQQFNALRAGADEYQEQRSLELASA